MKKNEIVDKKVILQRTKKYGNNFQTLAKIWKTYFKNRFELDIDFEPQDVAICMALHKISRFMINPLDQDTLTDLINYFWLGLDYDQYTSKIIQEHDKSEKNKSFTTQNIKL